MARDFSRCGKNLSPCGRFNDIDAKHEQKSAILPVRELAKDKLFILLLEDLPHVPGEERSGKHYTF
jgi:hypothetical protein